MSKIRLQLPLYNKNKEFDLTFRLHHPSPKINSTDIGPYNRTIWWVREYFNHRALMAVFREALDLPTGLVQLRNDKDLYRIFTT